MISTSKGRHPTCLFIDLKKLTKRAEGKLFFMRRTVSDIFSDLHYAGLLYILPQSDNSPTISPPTFLNCFRTLRLGLFFFVSYSLHEFFHSFFYEFSWVTSKTADEFLKSAFFSLTF